MTWILADQKNEDTVVEPGPGLPNSGKLKR